MKYMRLSILAISILLVSSNFAAAANTQELEWGVEAGDRIDYLMTFNNDQTDNLNEQWDIYCEIPTLPTIPDTVNSITDAAISISILSVFFSNGTAAPYGVPIVVFAIGNWTLIGELITSSVSSNTFVITETTTTWQYSVTYADGSTYGELHFSKDDGVLNYYKMESINEYNVVTYMTEIVRDGYSLGFNILGTDMMSSLIISGVAIVVLVIVIVCIEKRR